MAGRRRGRRPFVPEFRIDADGNSVYAGTVYRFQGGGAERKRALAVLWTLTAVMAVGAVAAGCVPAAGMQDTAYVLLPYAGSVLCVVSVVWLMCRLAYGWDALRDYVYKATVGQFRLRGVLTLCFSAATLAGDAVFLLLHGAGGQAGATAVFCVCEASILICAVLWLRVTQKLCWTASD